MTFQPDRRRSWLVGGFAVVVAFFSLVLLAAAIGSERGLSLFGFDVPDVTWMVVWGLMTAVAGGATAWSLRTALGRKPALVLDDTGLTYRLEITGERLITWDQVGAVEAKALNRSAKIVRVYRNGGGWIDIRPDLLLGATVDGLVTAICDRRDGCTGPGRPQSSHL